MNKYLIRIVSLVLVPGLLADPALASVWSTPRPIIQALSTADAFSDQALMARLSSWFLGTMNGTAHAEQIRDYRSETVENLADEVIINGDGTMILRPDFDLLGFLIKFSRRRSHGTGRRPSRAAQSSASPSPAPRSNDVYRRGVLKSLLIGFSSVMIGGNPWLRTKKLRAFLSGILILNGYFEDLLDGAAVSGIALTEDQIKDAPHQLDNLFKNGTLSPTLINVIAAVRPLKNEFLYTPALLAILKEKLNLVLLHESIHLTDLQKERRAQIQKIYESLVPVLRPYYLQQLIAQTEAAENHQLTDDEIFSRGLFSPAAARDNPAIANMARTWLRLDWENEIEAYHVEMTALTKRAGPQGLWNYLLGQAEPWARNDGVTTEVYAHRLIEQTSSIDNIELAVLQRHLRLAQVFEPGAVTDAFRTEILYTQMRGPSNYRLMTGLAQAHGEVFDPQFGEPTNPKSLFDPVYRQQWGEWAIQRILRNNSTTPLPHRAMINRKVGRFNFARRFAETVASSVAAIALTFAVVHSLSSGTPHAHIAMDLGFFGGLDELGPIEILSLSYLAIFSGDWLEKFFEAIGRTQRQYQNTGISIQELQLRISELYLRFNQTIRKLGGPTLAMDKEDFMSMTQEVILRWIVEHAKESPEIGLGLMWNQIEEKLIAQASESIGLPSLATALSTQESDERIRNSKTYDRELRTAVRIAFPFAGSSELIPSNANTAERAVFNNELRKAVISALETLDPLQTETMKLQFGIGSIGASPEGYAMTYEEMAAHLNMTVLKVRRNRTLALRNLRQGYRLYRLAKFLVIFLSALAVAIHTESHFFTQMTIWPQTGLWLAGPIAALLYHPRLAFARQILRRAA